MRAMVTALLALALPLIALPAAADQARCDAGERELQVRQSGRIVATMCLPDYGGAKEFDPITLEGLPSELVDENLRAYAQESEFLQNRLDQKTPDPKDCLQIFTRFRIAALELSRAIHNDGSDIATASKRANLAVFDLRTLCGHDRSIHISSRDERFANAVLDYTRSR